MAVCVLSGSTAVQAAIVDIDFESYEAGQQPPAPWIREYSGGSYTVEAGVGYEGTKGLVVPDGAAGVAYDLSSAPLTSEMGAVSISIMARPGLYSDPYGDSGSVTIGYGDKSLDNATFFGVVFEVWNGVRSIEAPEGVSLGSFTDKEWYSITFDLSEDWQTMQISAGQVDSTPQSMTVDWDGEDITRIWVDTGNHQSAAVYDNLTIVPEPGTMGLLALGGLAMIRRRRRTAGLLN